MSSANPLPDAALWWSARTWHPQVLPSMCPRVDWSIIARCHVSTARRAAVEEFLRRECQAIGMGQGSLPSDPVDEFFSSLTGLREGLSAREVEARRALRLGLGILVEELAQQPTARRSLELLAVGGATASELSSRGFDGRLFAAIGHPESADFDGSAAFTGGQTQGLRELLCQRARRVWGEEGLQHNPADDALVSWESMGAAEQLCWRVAAGDDQAALGRALAQALVRYIDEGDGAARPAWLDRPRWVAVLDGALGGTPCTDATLDFAEDQLRSARVAARAHENPPVDTKNDLQDALPRPELLRLHMDTTAPEPYRRACGEQSILLAAYQVLLGSGSRGVLILGDASMDGLHVLDEELAGLGLDLTLQGLLVLSESRLLRGWAPSPWDAIAACLAERL